MTKEGKTTQEQDKAAKQETATQQDKVTGAAKKKFDTRFLLGGTIALAVLIIASVLLYQKLHYANRWYRYTYINEVDVSGQTLAESKKTLENQYADYSLKITGRDGGELTIDGDDINFQFQMHSEIDTLFEKQHEKFKLFHDKEMWTQKFNISYDEQKLKEIITQSELVTGSSDYSITAPKSAFVTYAADKQQYICQKEVPGNKIVTENLLSVVQETMKKGSSELDLTKQETGEKVYKNPKYTADSEEIASQLKMCNSAVSRYIVWNMGKGNVEQITPAEISQWISCKNGKIKYDNEKIEEWVEAFCLKYKTVGITRKFKSHTGKMVKVAGGDYGWQLDYENMVKQAKKALKEAIPESDTQAYIEKPNEETKKKITLKRKAIYANTAYKKDYVNFKNDWDTENYTEISIKDQKVYVFRKGKLKFSCRCITGRPVEGRRTPTGTYYIKEHKAAYTLTGADYSTPVKNWVRITWTGTGFHPATWQPWSSWNKTMYKTRGSHGCINLSVSDAKKIYDLTKYREPVFIY